jgi:hypothetical protein
VLNRKDCGFRYKVTEINSNLIQKRYLIVDLQLKLNKNVKVKET